MTLKITAQADKKGKCGIVCSLRALSALFIALVSWANPIETVALLSEPVCLGLKRWLRLWGRRLLGVLEEIFPCSVPQNGKSVKNQKFRVAVFPSLKLRNGPGPLLDYQAAQSTPLDTLLYVASCS